MKNKLILGLVLLGISTGLCCSSNSFDDGSMQKVLEEAIVLRYDLQETQKKNKDTSDVDLRNADFNLESVSDGQVRGLLLKAFFANKNFSYSLLDGDGLEKLNVLVGSSLDRQACLSNVLPTVTAAGDLQVACMLAQPLVNHED